MNQDSSDIFLKTLQEIQEDTKEIALLADKINRFEEFVKKNDKRIIDIVVNNSYLNDKFNERALEAVKNYLNTDEAREKLDKNTLELMEKQYNKQVLRLLIKWLSIQGSILTIVFTAFVTWKFG